MLLSPRGSLFSNLRASAIFYQKLCYRYVEKIQWVQQSSCCKHYNVPQLFPNNAMRINFINHLVRIQFFTDEPLIKCECNTQHSTVCLICMKLKCEVPFAGNSSLVTAAGDGLILAFSFAMLTNCLNAFDANNV